MSRKKAHANPALYLIMSFNINTYSPLVRSLSVQHEIIDPKGNHLSLDILINEIRFILINAYAPRKKIKVVSYN